MSKSNREYYESLDKRLNILLLRIPSFRPLTTEQINVVEDMDVKGKEYLASVTEALIDSLGAQLKELEEIKQKAEKKTILRVV